MLARCPVANLQSMLNIQHSAFEMNCPNCGAAMQVNARGVLVCGHCGTNTFPDTVERDGIRLLGPSDSALSCPVCKTPFTGGLIDDYQVDYCESCHGLLLTRRDFAEL